MWEKGGAFEKNGALVDCRFGKSHGSYTRRANEETAVGGSLGKRKMGVMIVKTQMLNGRLFNQWQNVAKWRLVVKITGIHIFSKKHSVEKLRKWDEVNFGIVCKYDGGSRGAVAGC